MFVALPQFAERLLYNGHLAPKSRRLGTEGRLVYGPGQEDGQEAVLHSLEFRLPFRQGGRLPALVPRNVVEGRDPATLMAMIAGVNSYERMTAGQEAEVLARHRAAVAFAQNVLPQSRFRGVATGATRVVLARAFYSADHGKLRHFTDVLQSGIGSDEFDQPIMLLFRYLVEAANRALGDRRVTPSRNE